MRQGDEPVFHGHVFFDHFGIHIVKLVAHRKRRISDAGHFGRVFADEVRRIGHIQSLLKHQVCPLQVLDIDIELRIPGVLPVKLVPEPGVHSRVFIFVRL